VLICHIEKGVYKNLPLRIKYRCRVNWARKAIISKDIYQTDRIVDDPTDNKFLACALEKKADYIVSRDPHLRNLKHYHGIQIIDATTFIAKVDRSGD
jgi:predicted nucleic acid-binding protein